MIAPEEIARLRELDDLVSLYEIIDYENMKEGQPVLGFGCHVLKWNFDTMGQPAYGIIPIDVGITDLLDEIERLQVQLRAATLVVGNDPDTFDWNALSKMEEQERVIEQLRADLAAALKRAEVAEGELRVLRLPHTHGEHDDHCPRCEAERNEFLPTLRPSIETGDPN